jgi:hypothetical protein
LASGKQCRTNNHFQVITYKNVLALTMDLSIPKDASDASEDAASEKDYSELEEVASEKVINDSCPNEEDSETAALLTADPLANLKADFESLKAVFESQNADFKSQLDSQKTKADFERLLISQKNQGRLREPAWKPEGRLREPADQLREPA